MKWLGLLKKRVFTALLSVGFILTTASASQALTQITVNTFDTAANAVKGTWHVQGKGVGAGKLPCATGVTAVVASGDSTCPGDAYSNFDWQVTGATLYAGPASAAANYNITFGNIPGYTKPATTAGTPTGTYNATGGTGYTKDTVTSRGFHGNETNLKVILAPTNTSAGVALGAAYTHGVGAAGWSLDGGTIWYTNGQTASAPVAYTITFKGVAGWRTPLSKSGNLSASHAAVTGFSGTGYAGAGTNDPYTITVPYQHAANDYDNDGASEPMFRSVTTGYLYTWNLPTTTVSGGGYIDTNPGVQGTTASPGAIIAQADFNGDGVTDLLFEDTSTRALSIWFMSGANGVVSQSNTITLTRTSTDVVVGAADFTGDGRADILMIDSTSTLLTAKLLTFAAAQFTAATGAAMTPTSTTVSPTITTTSAGTYGTHTGWHVAALADFDGDGKADILWRFANSSAVGSWVAGQTSIWYMNGATRTTGGSLPSQLGAYQNVDGTTSAPTGWLVDGVGDFDGDGYTDILYRFAGPSTSVNTIGQSAVWLLTGQSGGIPTRTANGTNTATIVTGQTRGSGKTVDAAGTIVNAGAFTATTGWQVVGVGDFDGAGKDDVLWRYAGTGHTYVWFMNGRTITAGSGFTSVYPGTVATWASQPMRTIQDPQ